MADPGIHLDNITAGRDDGRESEPVDLKSLLPGLIQRLATEPETMTGLELELSGQVIGSINRVIELERERREAQIELRKLSGDNFSLDDATDSLRVDPQQGGATVLSLVRSIEAFGRAEGTDTRIELKPRHPLVSEMIHFAESFPKGTVLRVSDFVRSTSLGVDRRHHAAVSMFHYYLGDLLSSGVVQKRGPGGKSYEVVRSTNPTPLPVKESLSRQSGERDVKAIISVELFCKTLMDSEAQQLVNTDFADMLGARSQQLANFAKNNSEAINAWLAEYGKELFTFMSANTVTMYYCLIETGTAEEYRSKIQLAKQEAIDKAHATRAEVEANITNFATEVYKRVSIMSHFTIYDVMNMYTEEGILVTIPQAQRLIYPKLESLAAADGLCIGETKVRGRPRKKIVPLV